jgi:hypothetical protein
MSGKGGGTSAVEMHARHFNRLMAAPLRVSCAFCRWSAEGEAGELLKRAKRHRERRHKIVDSHPSRRSSRHLTTFRQPFLTEQDRDEIEREISRRRRLHGLEEEVAA